MLSVTIILIGFVIFLWLENNDNKAKKKGILTWIGAFIFALSFLVAWPISQGILAAYNKEHTKQVLYDQRQNCIDEMVEPYQCKEILDIVNGKYDSSYKMIEDK